MTNKERYAQFCQTTYVPIYSKPWWMDAVCGPENWDVWLYESGGEVLAAMPYYMEQRGPYRYITKPPLTQNNGIIFKERGDIKLNRRHHFEETVINAACTYIQSLGIDVYEQQYQTSFTNWLPFFWNHYTQVTRYTYIIDNTADLEAVFQGIERNRRGKIKKGQKNTVLRVGMDPETFYFYNSKIYEKQNLKPPFSYELWERIYLTAIEHGCGKIMYREDINHNIACISFVIWDDCYLYKLIGGVIPTMASLDAHSAMTWDEIMLAHDMGLKFDFEGSVIKRISKSFREYGGTPMPYFRIRKVFNPDIVRKEAEDYIAGLAAEQSERNGEK